MHVQLYRSERPRSLLAQKYMRARRGGEGERVYKALGKVRNYSDNNNEDNAFSGFFGRNLRNFDLQIQILQKIDLARIGPGDVSSRCGVSQEFLTSLSTILKGLHACIKMPLHICSIIFRRGALKNTLITEVYRLATIVVIFIKHVHNSNNSCYLLEAQC